MTFSKRPSAMIKTVKAVSGVGSRYSWLLTMIFLAANAAFTGGAALNGYYTAEEGDGWFVFVFVFVV